MRCRLECIKGLSARHDRPREREDTRYQEAKKSRQLVDWGILCQRWLGRSIAREDGCACRFTRAGRLLCRDPKGTWQSCNWAWRVGLRSKRVYECGGRFLVALEPQRLRSWRQKDLRTSRNESTSELDKELGKHGREFAHLSVVLA